MSETRRINVQIIIEGKNVTENVSQFLSSVSYTDVLEGEANTAQINLSDRDRLFLADWFPHRGDTAQLIFTKRNWIVEGDSDILDVGTFELDEIDNSIGSSGCKTVIKLNSIANKSELRSIDKSRSWEKVKLSKIAKDLSDSAKMELFYDTDEDPMIDRAEQKELSNLKFLHKLCKDNGLCLKVSFGKVVIFDSAKYEQKEPIKTFVYDGGEIISFRGRATISKIYKSCRVKYQNGKQGEKIETTFTDKTKESGEVLEVNQKVSSHQEAEKLAKKKLREKNKDEFKVNLQVIGDFALLAGQNVKLEGFGFYDQKYIIEKSTFNFGKGFTCDLELRRCLNEY